MTDQKEEGETNCNRRFWRFSSVTGHPSVAARSKFRKRKWAHINVVRKFHLLNINEWLPGVRTSEWEVGGEGRKKKWISIAWGACRPKTGKGSGAPKRPKWRRMRGKGAKGDKGEGPRGWFGGFVAYRRTWAKCGWLPGGLPRDCGV